MTAPRCRHIRLFSFSSWLAQCFLVFALFYGSSTFGQVYNTGVDNSNQVKGPNTTELHWYLSSLPDPNPANPPIGPSHAVIETPLNGWVSSSTAQWIGPPLSNGDANTVVPTGTYVYKTKYTLPKYVDPNSVVITGSYASADGSPGVLTPFTLDRTNASFGPGDNFISLTTQSSSGHSGAIIDNLNLTYNLFPAPVISFADPVYSYTFYRTITDFERVSYLDGTPNSAINFSIPATNSPTSYQAAGLPPDFSLNTTTGLISGTPLLAESCPVKLTAQNSYGFDTKTLTFQISNWNLLSPTIVPQAYGNAIIPQAFGNGIYVNISAAYNTSYTSTDAQNWAGHTIDESPQGYLNCVFFANGMFVAGGTNGIIYTSTDGVTWTLRQSGGTAVIRDFTFGNGTFVGIADAISTPNFSLEIFTSADGQTWSTQSLDDQPASTLKRYFSKAITFGSNMFVAVGEFGIYSSSDAQTWTLREGPAIDGYSSDEHNVGFRSVAFGNGQFLALGTNSSRQEVFETSVDGITWTQQPPPSPEGYKLDKIFFGDGTFLASAGRSVSNGPVAPTDSFNLDIFFSSDGINWLRTVLSERNHDEPISISFGNDLFFALRTVNLGDWFGSAAFKHGPGFPAASTVSFANSSYQVFENNGSVSVTLTRSGDLNGRISVLCNTPPITDTSIFREFEKSYTALDDTDFQALYQTVIFAPGEVTKSVSIPITNNTSSSDGRREFTVELKAQTEGVAVGDVATVSILDDDKSLQIEAIDSEQDSFNNDNTVSFSASLVLGNTKPSPTGPVRIKLVAIPGYRFYHPSFDAAPALPSQVVLGTFDVSSSISASSTIAQAVNGVVPAPQASGGGYFFWWAYAQLEEQVGGNWYDVPGAWPVDDGAILVQTSSGVSGCHHPPPGGAGCVDTGGGISVNPGSGGPLPTLPPPPTLSGLNINGPSQVNKNSSTQYSVTGSLSDGTSVSPDNVTWSASAFSISPTGVLTASSVKKSTPVTITATATVAGVTQTSSLNVTVTKSKSLLATPTISPSGGTFSQSVQVIISDAALGATIRYTTNGSTPSKKSPVYSGPFTLTTSATVNAIATASGASNSSVASASFTITP